MDTKEILSMISLLDDTDQEVVSIVESKIKDLGSKAIPTLSEQWTQADFNPVIKDKLGEILYDLKFEYLFHNLINWKKDQSEDLLKGLWLISTYQNPELKYSVLQEIINELHYAVWIKGDEYTHPYDLIKNINYVIFNEFRFEPNVRHYHSPENSFFSTVLEKKSGNPLALSCLYLLIAQRLEVPIFGANLPNIFILIYNHPQIKFYIDPFNKGNVFQRKDIIDYLAQMNVEPSETYFQPCTNLDIMKRMLTNLALSYQKTEENQKHGEVLKLLEIFQ